MRPLVKMLNDLKRVGATDGDAYRFARCLTSLRVLANHSPEFYALDADGVAEARKSIDELESWLADDSNGEFVEKDSSGGKGGSASGGGRRTRRVYDERNARRAQSRRRTIVRRRSRARSTSLGPGAQLQVARRQGPKRYEECDSFGNARRASPRVSPRHHLI